MIDTWGLLHTGHHDAATNMALDEMLLTWHSQGEIPPTLRFYGWTKPTLSLGHFQRIHRTIDLDAVKRHGCELVRRLTGGSAVLHDDELTYSLVVSEEKPYIAASVREAYFTLSKGILEGFKELGIHADYSMPEGKAKGDSTAVCFERASIYEMLVDRKKISGHAQTRQKGVLLQHGSLPFTMNKQMLFDLFIFPDEKMREAKRSDFSSKAIAMKEAAGRSITFEEAEIAFQKGFQKGLQLELVPLELSDSQWEEVRQLAETKYRSDDWNINHRRKVLVSGSQ
ncbi:MAG TPA: lipoate--protein ligase family protein [Bacillaceae bacterium]